MTKKTTLTVAIPFFNEDTQLLKTISVLKKCPSISKIICIDDGSTNTTSDLLKKEFPTVTVLTHKSNKGKFAAVKTALKEITTSHVLLFDADLSSLRTKEIELNCKQALEADATAVIFKQTKDSFFLKLLKFDILFSGERILKTQILKKMLQTPAANYSLEFVINEFLLSHNLPVYCLPFHSKNKLKLSKWPVLTSFRKSFQFYKLLLRFQYIKHWLYFNPKELKNINATMQDT